MRPRLAISGLGGSGTRIFAELIRQFGYHIGDDLNHASDNLWWTLLFKRQSVLDEGTEQLELLYDAFVNRMQNRPQVDEVAIRERVGQLVKDDRIQHPANWLRQRSASFLAAPKQPQAGRSHWAWKEPNTHIIADFLLEYDQELTLIHVVRDPIYMSFSTNQNQLEFWGPARSDGLAGNGPSASLAYWCQTHLRLERIARKFPGRFIFVSHEYACMNPNAAVDALASFVGVELQSQARDEASALISIDRMASAQDEQRAYPFATADFLWARDYMRRHFGGPISRLYRTNA